MIMIMILTRCGCAPSHAHTLPRAHTHACTGVHAATTRRYVVPADEGRAGLACFAPTSSSLVAGGANAMLYLWDLSSEVMGRVAEMPPSVNSGEEGSPLGLGPCTLYPVPSTLYQPLPSAPTLYQPSTLTNPYLAPSQRYSMLPLRTLCNPLN